MVNKFIYRLKEKSFSHLFYPQASSRIWVVRQKFHLMWMEISVWRCQVAFVSSSILSLTHIHIYYSGSRPVADRLSDRQISWSSLWPQRSGTELPWLQAPETSRVALAPLLQCRVTVLKVPHDIHCPKKRELERSWSLTMHSIYHLSPLPFLAMNTYYNHFRLMDEI